MSKKIIFILLSLLIILGFIGFWYYRNAIFSKEILKLEILGRDSAKIADEIEYTVKYKNNGNFVLEQPKLIFELPENSVSGDGKIRFTQNLKDIYPGQEDFVKFKGRFFGKEGDLKVAKAHLSYIPKNLSARYESSTTFTTKISAIPITLTFDLPSKVEQGKEITYSVNYFSNLDYLLENASIKIDPVKGFDFKSANPSSLDNSEWKINSLKKGQGGRITIKGMVSSGTGDQLTFLAKLGLWRDGQFVVLKEVEQGAEVIHPLLFVSQQINGLSDYIASPGETLNYRIFLRNIGSTPFDNLFLIARLEGEALDFSTLESSQGQAKPNDNLIVFDSKQIRELQNLAPQQEVKVEFSIRLKDNLENKNNAVVKNKVNVFDISEEFTTKVSSKLELFQRAYYSSFEGIENSGPMPPEVGKITTYIINWQVKNYLNDIKNIKVKAFLPENVGISDNIFPESQAYNFSFDTASREIVWSAGNLPAGGQASLFFQIALTPHDSQRGNLATLIGEAAVFAEDQFTGVVAKETAPALKTDLPDDQANSGKGIIQ